VLLHLPIADLRPLPGVPLPSAKELRSLADSVRRHGILEPLTVRPAKVSLIVQEGWQGGRHGYYVVKPSAAKGKRYEGVPRFFTHRDDALAALPADVPYEVCHGVKRLYAASLAKRKTVPCVVCELTDEQVAELRGAAVG